jgi:hypothetical protein
MKWFKIGCGCLLAIVALIVLMVGVLVAMTWYGQVKRYNEAQQPKSVSLVNREAYITDIPLTARDLHYDVDNRPTEEWFYFRDDRAVIDAFANRQIGEIPKVHRREYYHNLSVNARLTWFPKEQPPGSRFGEAKIGDHTTAVTILDRPGYSEVWVYRLKPY